MDRFSSIAVERHCFVKDAQFLGSFTKKKKQKKNIEEQEVANRESLENKGKIEPVVSLFPSVPPMPRLPTGH